MKETNFDGDMSEGQSDRDSPSPGQSPTASKTELKKRNIDVINLSSQLTSMQILSKRKAKKRVRFELPEEDNRPASSKDFVSFQKLSKTKQKKLAKKFYKFREGFSISDSQLLCEGKKSYQNRYKADLQEGSSLGSLLSDTSKDHQPSTKRLRLDADFEDVNNNSSFSTKQYNRRKLLRERRLMKKRTRKFKINIKRLTKAITKFRAQLLKKAKERIRQKQKRKQSSEESKYGASLAKKSKGVHKSQSKLKHRKSIKRDTKTVQKDSKSSYKRKLSKSFAKRCDRSGRSNKNTKGSGKIRRNVLVAKSLTNKALKRKHNLKRKQKIQAAKRLARKKAELKKKIAEKRRKKQRKMSKPSQKLIPRQKKPKKPRFIPIIREEDVCNSMCTSLLIYRTLQRANSEHLHCCEKKCWRDWEELDIEDVYIDYE